MWKFWLGITIKVIQAIFKILSKQNFCRYFYEKVLKNAGVSTDVHIKSLNKEQPFLPSKFTMLSLVWW